nr:hypothetical protein Josef01_05d18_13 [uncultured archaeon]
MYHLLFVLVRMKELGKLLTLTRAGYRQNMIENKCIMKMASYFAMHCSLYREWVANLNRLTFLSGWSEGAILDFIFNLAGYQSVPVDTNRDTNGTPVYILPIGMGP